MESTGVYWIPLFQILEKRKIEPVLVNAQDLPQSTFSPYRRRPSGFCLSSSCWRMIDVV